jgi:hypothetical protein
MFDNMQVAYSCDDHYRTIFTAPCVTSAGLKFIARTNSLYDKSVPFIGERAAQAQCLVLSIEIIYYYNYTCTLGNTD